MTNFRILSATLATLAISLPATAQSLKPIQSQSIDLGTVAGDAYYTVESDGFHVVATFAQRNGGTPMRFQASLASGQSIVFSSPRNASELPASVKISRQNDQVLVHTVAETN